VGNDGDRVGMVPQPFHEAMSWHLLQNSLLVAVLTTLLAGLVGFAVALAIAGMESRGRAAWLAAAIVALVLPPFLVTNCWLDLLGQDGLLRPWLPLNIYSEGGAVLLLTLLSWPVTTLFALGAWNRLAPSQLESDPALRGLALVRWLLWPMARGAVGSAAVLTFVLTLNNFAVPVILQVPVFPEELWLAFTTRLNNAGAWAAAWPLVVAPAILLVLLRHAEVPWPRAEGGASARALREQFGRPWLWAARAFAALVCVLAIAAPLLQLAGSRRTWTELPNLLRAAPETVTHSLAYAAVAASACLLLGFLTWRWKPGTILWLLMFVPGMLLGQGLLLAFQETVLYGTPALVMLAFALRYLAIGRGGVALAMRGADREWLEAAQLDGARGWSLLRHATWPQIAPQVAASWYAVYLLCLWEVESLVFLQPPGGETLALRAFNMLHYGHTAQVNAVCVLLLGLALAPWLAWCIAQRILR